MKPLAYFLTWTTYGTWLHGDARGSVDDEHNRPSTPLATPNDNRREYARSQLAESPLAFDADDRGIVTEVIERHAHHRLWPIHALNVRSNHVHVVLSAPDHTPEEVVRQLKAWSTRSLREAGRIDGREHVWTKRASTRWINDEDSLAKAIDYVLNHQ